MSSNINPYVVWLQLPESSVRPTYYELLGVREFESDERKIKGGYYRSVARVSVYQTGPTAEICARILTELAEARDCLVDSNARAKYDATLRRKVGSQKTVATKPATRKSEDSASAQAALALVKVAESPTVVDSSISLRPSSQKTVFDREPRNSNVTHSVIDLDRPRTRPTPNGFAGSNFQQPTLTHPRTNERKRITSQSRPGSWRSIVSVLRTPDEIVADVVAKRGLTTFQARCVSDHNTDRLVLGPYLLEHELVTGVWGQTYLASKLKTGELVVLRSLAPSLHSEVTQLKACINLVAKLDADQFQLPLECSRDGDRIFIASQYVPGEDLRSLVQRAGSFTPQQAVYCIARATESMAIANKAGLQHWELRPSKLVINRSGGLCIRDLALANVVHVRKRKQSNLTQLAAVLPKSQLSYFAPESFGADVPSGVQSDIYSLGCILYYLLTGEELFVNDDPLQVMIAHQESPIPDRDTISPNLTDLLYHCLQRMLAKRPADRFQSYGQLHQQLKLVYSDLPSPAPIRQSWQHVDEMSPLDRGPRPPLQRVHWRRLGTKVGLVAGLVAAIAAGGVYATADPKEAEPLMLQPQTATKKSGPNILRDSDGSAIPEVQAHDVFNVR
jgi:hypothetical protein